MTAMQVFLSHSQSRRPEADHLRTRLQDAGFGTWSEQSVLPGDLLHEKIAEALRSADAMVVLVTADWIQSKWARNEIEHAIGDERFQGRLIPVVLETEAREDMPWILKHLPYIDATGDFDEASDRVIALLRESQDRRARHAG